MSLFSGDCQELAPCAVPVQHPSQTNYGSSTAATSTTALGNPQQLQQPHSRKSSNASTAIDMGCAEGGGHVHKSHERQETGESGEGGNGSKNDNTQREDDDESKITKAPSSVTRVFKKCASNGSLALYVGTRTVTIDGAHLEPLKGIIVLDKEALQQNISENFKIWGQITLTFRYGREDEEVLGLRFCNEAILALKQLWPPLPKDPEEEEDEDENLTPLQGVLLDRVSSSANSPSIHSVPFTLCAGPVGIGAFPPPPSVLLAPAKPYKGSPIGTLYDLRIYASERPEERPPRRNTIRLALRAVQTPPQEITLDVQGCIESRPTILSRGKIRLHCELNTNAVRYGETLEVNLTVQNNSRSSIRRILVSLIQQVDVCMFTSGKFKNIVGHAEDNIFLVPGASYQKRYNLTPQRGPARQWLALEEAFGRDPVLAPSTCTEGLEPALELTTPQQKGSNRSRNVFAIIVSYYVKVKLILGGLALCQSLKVPFVLLPPSNPDDPDPYPGVGQTAEIDFNAPENFVMAQGGVSERNILSDLVTAKTQSLPDPEYGTTSDGSGGVAGEDSGTCDNNGDETTTKRTIKSTERLISTSSSSVVDGGGRGGGGARRKSSSASSITTQHPQHHQQLTLHQHQPQIHHHHLAASPATTPSPVKVPTVPSTEHLF